MAFPRGVGGVQRNLMPYLTGVRHEQMLEPECADCELDNRRGFGRSFLGKDVTQIFGYRSWEQKFGSEEATDEARQCCAWTGGDFEE